jgi:hypothetical protein
LEQLIGSSQKMAKVETKSLNGTIVQPMLEKHDPNFTDNVILAMGPKTSPRMREVMTGLIRHLHDFARETNLTVSEWMAGVDMVRYSYPSKAFLNPK